MRAYITDVVQFDPLIFFFPISIPVYSTLTSLSPSLFLYTFVLAGQEINSVSEFYYQVPYPACHDTFTVSDEAW